MEKDTIQDEIVEAFSFFDDWTDKYEYIIESGKKLRGLEIDIKKDELLIKGCQSRVWLLAEYSNGVINYTADSDAVITKGIVSLLIRALSGRTPEDIIKTDLYFIDKIGLKEHLSPTRSNGLLSMIKQMKLYALAFKAKNDNNNGSR
jgi:cysteine desulfuration protein SufE